jgi:hypothetical protein
MKKGLGNRALIADFTTAKPTPLKWLTANSLFKPVAAIKAVSRLNYLFRLVSLSGSLVEASKRAIAHTLALLGRELFTIYL